MASVKTHGRDTGESYEKNLRGDSGGILRFVVLLPHRDMEGPLRSQSRVLFAAGINGAWSFPLAVPLALVSRPFTPGELRALAGAVRASSLQGAGNEAKTGAGQKNLNTKDTEDTKGKKGSGKIAIGTPVLVSWPGGFSFFGPRLDIAPPPLPFPGVVYPFPTLVLCTALALPGDEAAFATIGDLPAITPPGFRAARVANLSIKPLKCGGDYSFVWRIGEERWLPPARCR
jgi:hypothetical protein